jgi:hypothetical protein
MDISVLMPAPARRHATTRQKEALMTNQRVANGYQVVVLR